MAINRFAAFALIWLVSSSSTSSAGLGRTGITFVSAFVARSNNNHKSTHNHVNTIQDRKWKAETSGSTRRNSRFSNGKQNHHQQQQRTVVMNNFIGDLWEELIEFSTYGPAERKLLKERRRLQQQKDDDNLISVRSSEQIMDDDYSGSISLAAFQAAVKKRSTEGSSTSTAADNSEYATTTTATAVSDDISDGDDENINFDGYQLRDLLMAKWGIPLDIDFQRGYQGNSVYCTVVPVAYGSKKCRHVTELDYLMHLQGVVEILYKYDNLDPFLNFLETTTRQPKANTDSVPFLLNLSPSQLERILNTKKSSSKS